MLQWKCVRRTSELEGAGRASRRRPWPHGASCRFHQRAHRRYGSCPADNGLLAPELAEGITRVRGVASKGVRLRNWLTVRQAQALQNAPDATTSKGLRGRAIQR
jgi:hypothetical protein